ncbi:MAG: hypothetical protein IKS42_08675 [Oscillospiraceae bacterium]|nr:hypothetical protein [Oscillospiraceae bacterium]
MGFNTKKFAALTGLTFDKSDSLFYGLYATYPVTAQYNARRSLLICRVTGKDPLGRSASEIQADLDNFRMARTGIVQLSYQNRELAAAVAIPSRQSNEGAAEMLRALTELAAHLGLEPCCEGCGADYGWDFYALDGQGVVICDDCRSYTERNMADIREEKSQERANVPGLILGILIGAVTVFLATYIVLRMGFVSYLTGYLGMFVGFVCMKKFGKKITIPSAIVAVLCGLAVAAVTPMIEFSGEIADINQENYSTFAQFNMTYAELKETSADLTAEERQEAEKILGTSFAELESRHVQYTEAMEHTTTGSVIKDFPKLLKNDLYSGVKSELIKCILWGVLSIIIGSAVTLPAMLRESGGIHKLRRLGI